MATVGEALVGVSTGLLYPEIMTDADIGTIPGSGDRCRFRFTRVGYPVFVYSPSAAVIKLNGKLVPLASSGDGVYRDGAVTVTHRELDYGDGLFAAELVLHLQDAPNELGFHGFTECPGR